MSVAVMNAIKSQLQAAAPSRVVTREWLAHDDRDEADLKKGLFTIMASVENDYATYLGRHAQLGKQRVFIVGQILLPEHATGEQVEDAEFGLIDDLKAFAQSSLSTPIDGLYLLSVQNSSQLERPWGWVSSEWQNGV